MSIIKHPIPFMYYFGLPGQMRDKASRPEKKLAALESMAKTGCPPAALWGKAIKHYKAANKIISAALKNQIINDQKMVACFVTELAETYKVNESIPEWIPNDYLNITAMLQVNHLSLMTEEPSELDKAIRICYAFFEIAHFEKTLNFTQECILKYPEEPVFYYIKGCLLGWLEKYNEAFQFAQDSLKKFPGNLRLLYVKANAVWFSKDFSESQEMEAYKDYLQHAHLSDQYVPEFYYRVAGEYARQLKEIKDPVDKTKPEKFTKLYKLMCEALAQAGKAERMILPCLTYDQSYIPQKLCARISFQKEQTRMSYLQKMISIKLYRKVPILPPAKSFTNKRERQLHDPLRMEIVYEHRKVFHMFSEITAASNQQQVRNDLITKSMKPYLEELNFDSSTLESLEPIFLRDINYQHDQIYFGRIIEFLSILPPIVAGSFINLIVEDANGDAMKCNIYNLSIQQVQNLRMELSIGNKFSIAQPYLRTGVLDHKPYIRIKFDCLILYPEKRLKDICSYCIKENAIQRCGRCHISNYCNKNCQRKDWKIMNHKDICNFHSGSGYNPDSMNF